MTFKVINMAEHTRDAEDRLLESMFASEVIADNGFSARVVSRVLRRIWLRRLTLPVATLFGTLVAYKPVVGLLTTVSELSALIPQDVLGVPTDVVPQLPMLMLGAVLFATCMVGLRLLED